MNYERYSYAMAPKQTEWTQTGDQKIGCVQHDCDNCKAHRDLLVRHLAEIERLRAENEALKAALSQLDATACADRHLTELSQDTANRLMSEVKALKADAERWKFTLWWQDQNPRPEHIQDCLTNMHRWARKRGALGPNSEELQLAVDHAMAARSK